LRILLAGGLGYVGGRLAEWLGAARHELVLGSRDPARASGNDAARVVRLDWSSAASLDAACRGVEAVIHLAGMNAAACAADPVGARATYGEGTSRLLAAATRQGVGRFLYLSSAHVYGDALAGVVDEDVEPRPRHPYALGHAAAEQVLRAAHGAVQIRIARLSNAVGAPADPRADCWWLLANDLARQAVRTGSMALRTAGTQRRDFIALGEACRALAHLLELPAERAGNGLFNVGGNATMSVFELAQLIAARVQAVSGSAPPISVGAGSDAAGDSLREYSSARLAASGFAPRPAALAGELDRLISSCAS
jgi:UDP-glucose 4-epimerase